MWENYKAVEEFYHVTSASVSFPSIQFVLSFQLSELHVYILPQDKWIPFRRLARNTVIEETVSAGFVRVPYDLTLADLRRELRGQLADEDLPEHFVYIKSVGRNFTQVGLMCGRLVGGVLLYPLSEWDRSTYFCIFSFPVGDVLGFR